MNRMHNDAKPNMIAENEHGLEEALDGSSIRGEILSRFPGSPFGIVGIVAAAGSWRWWMARHRRRRPSAV